MPALTKAMPEANERVNRTEQDALEGFARAGLIGNDGAQFAYERAGFEVTGEKCHPEFEAVYGCPGVRSLSRPL